jgi:predicted alpha/beta hydrolase family esterase
LVGKNWAVIEPVLLLHGYDSKPSALGDLADRIGVAAELVAGFEDLAEETFAWWLHDLSIEAGQDLTEYLDEISLEASKALRIPKVVGLAGMLASKSAGNAPEHSLSEVVGSVAVVGFSQGAAAAVNWLLDPSRQTRVTTVIAVAGFLPDLAEERLREIVAQAGFRLAEVQIHAVHLSDDEVVDAMVSERASRQLAKAGFLVTNHHVDGSHAWSPALTDLVAYLLSNPQTV